MLDLLAELQREATREDVPKHLKQLHRTGLLLVTDLLEAVRAGNVVGVEEIVLGSRQVLPRWARGTEDLKAVLGFVDVDESQDPVTVTIHWERVPRRLRPAAASLASEFVDWYQPRPKGGRPRHTAPNKSARKTG